MFLLFFLSVRKGKQDNCDCFICVKLMVRCLDIIDNLECTLMHRIKIIRKFQLYDPVERFNLIESHPTFIFKEYNEDF